MPSASRIDRTGEFVGWIETKKAVDLQRQGAALEMSVGLVCVGVCLQGQGKGNVRAFAYRAFCSNGAAVRPDKVLGDCQTQAGAA